MPNFETKKFILPNKTKFRNLQQYQNMSDEEFDEVFEKKMTGVLTNKEFESRIQRKLDDFAKDYDISDLKSNDHLTLRALAQAYLSLEDIENISYGLRSGGLEMEDVFQLEKLNTIMSKLRDDISKMQDDLKITRKVRKGDKEESVVLYIEKLKEKSKQFYKSRMSYAFCPECKMLLGTVWFMNPDSDKSRIKLFCDRCEKITVNITAKELADMKGVNIEDVPDFYK